MAKTAMINARITPELKAKGEKILKRLGLSTTEAITIFFAQIKEHGGLPFEVKLPNRTTLKTFKRTDEGKDLNKYENPDAFFKKMRS